MNRRGCRARHEPLVEVASEGIKPFKELRQLKAELGAARPEFNRIDGDSTAPLAAAAVLTMMEMISTPRRS